VLDAILAYVAGLLILINPCVLPLVPLIGASAISRHPAAPLAMAAGMAASFTIAGLGVFTLTRALGVPNDSVAIAAGWLMIGLGLVMLIPWAQVGFSRLAGAAAGGGTRLMGQVEGRGLAGEAAAGALLGVAWSPCIGPTLGAALALAAQGQNLAYAATIMVMFSLGAVTIMLALAYGARTILTRRRDLLMRIAPHAKTILAVGALVVGLIIVLRLDRLLEGWAITVLPGWLVDLSVSL
jgi:cytochrome c biogenesis protein CcdA